MAGAYEDVWSRIKQISPVHIALRPEQIFAIGRIITQWGALEPFVDLQITMLGRYHNIPPEIIALLPGRHTEFKRRLSYLKSCVEYVVADQALKRECHERLSAIAVCKNKRDWFAHGTYDSVSNQSADQICINYNNHKFRISTAKAYALADEISLLSGWLINLGWRVNEGAFRTLQERFERPSDLL